ncbi:MAG: acyl-CoA desaturase [Pseudomonadota bacterium]
MSDSYSNPRIDGAHASGDAAEGRVRADPVKVFWVGGMLVFGTLGSALTISAGGVLLFVVSTLTTLCLGHSLGMHRRLIHRSYDCPKWMEYLFVHFGVLVGFAGPFGMLRTHDTRDWAQRQARCHPYFSHASVWYRDLWWQLFCRIELERPPELRMEREIVADPVYRFMEKTWMLQQLPWAGLFYVAGGWGWVFWGIASRVSVSVLGHWFIGYFAHRHGGRNWHVDGAAVQGHNVRWCALLTMGENWHNNHHAFPGSAKLGLEAGEWDPGWWVLCGLKRLGLVSNFVLPDALPQRRELRRLRQSGSPAMVRS